MKKVVIIHNPRCSKSNKTLEIIIEKGFVPEIIDYLKNPLSLTQLEALKEKLNKHPKEWLRQKERVLEEINLDLNDSQAVLDAMVQYPILIERPIVIVDNEAVIGRPPENVLSLL